MESLETLSKLEIETNKIFYDKKTDVLSIYIYDFVFIGNYKKSTKIKKVLDDLYNSLGEISLTRENIFIIDFVTRTPVKENIKLKHLNLLSKKEKEKKEKELEEPVLHAVEKKKRAERSAIVREEAKEDKVERFKRKDIEEEELLYEEMEEEVAYDEYRDFDDSRRAKTLEPQPSTAPPSPKAAPPPPPEAEPPTESLRGLEEAPEELIPVSPKPIEYEINMGLHYFSVMMEQTSYLFYVYFSHKELKIVDEEGKTIFETTIRIEILKKEPPILDLRVEGEDFEVHPLHGKVEVKKDAINPPVMIFSVLPVKKKMKTKKEKKEGVRRYLHVYVNYEEKAMNHTILSIIVQPKHFRLDIGPIHLNISKKTAAIISFISIIIAFASLIFTIFSIDPSSTFIDFISNFAPGLGSILFVVIFLITLFKEGIYPLKEKISSFLNFDKTGMIIK